MVERKSSAKKRAFEAMDASCIDSVKHVVVYRHKLCGVDEDKMPTKNAICDRLEAGTRGGYGRYDAKSAPSLPQRSSVLYTTKRVLPVLYDYEDLTKQKIKR
jgi:hypothetical protein